MENLLSKLKSNLRTEGFDYASCLADIHKDKKAAQASGNEVQANHLWVTESVVKVHQQFVEMFNLLKAGKYYDAWCKAEQVEISIHFLSRNSKEGFDEVSDLNETVHKLQSLYPYKVFASYVVKVKKEKCTICGKDRSINNFCGHRVGHVYNGELCLNEVTDFSFKGLDIVFNPEHKYSVLFTSDADGHHDQYDYTLPAGLMHYWTSAFQKWRYEVKHNYKQKNEFPGLADDSYCPCGSGKTYEECCSKDPNGIKHRLYTFIVEQIS